MTTEWIEQKIDNIPNLNQFIDINNQFLKKNLICLGGWEEIIDDFMVIIQELRIELCKAIKAQEQKKDYFLYYKTSLEFFAKHFLASIERLLQGHIQFALSHCRPIVEGSIILYLHHKGDITFDEIENGEPKELDTRNLYKKFEKKAKKLGASNDDDRHNQLYNLVMNFLDNLDKKRSEHNEKEPISIYQYLGQIEQDMHKPDIQRKYPSISERILKFLNKTSELALHANFQNVMLNSGWVHYPIKGNQLRTYISEILAYMFECLALYIEVYEKIIGQEPLREIIKKYKQWGQNFSSLRKILKHETIVD